jgi:hypothetical protein
MFRNVNSRIADLVHFGTIPWGQPGFWIYSLAVPELPTITLVELRSRAESWGRVERPGGD